MTDLAGAAQRLRALLDWPAEEGTLPWPGYSYYAAAMNYLLGVFLCFVGLWAAYDRFGTQGLIIIAVCLLVGGVSLYKAFDSNTKLTPGQCSLLTWVGAITAIPAALALVSGLFEELSR